MNLKLKNSEVSELLTDESYEFPKYTTQLMNLANQNSQGTRARNVGQMSDLIQEFEGKSIDEWKEWYLKRYPKALDVAAEKIYEMMENLKKAIREVDKEMVEK